MKDGIGCRTKAGEKKWKSVVEVKETCQVVLESIYLLIGMVILNMHAYVSFTNSRKNVELIFLRLPTCSLLSILCDIPVKDLLQFYFLFDFIL